jgi:putative oxidoreductase
MSNALQNFLTLAGRLLLALLFLPAGLMKIGGFAGTVGYIGFEGAAAAHCWAR